MELFGGTGEKAGSGDRVALPPADCARVALPLADRSISIN